jgi:ribosomal protein S18 acetylase RimI-like enzyme
MHGRDAERVVRARDLFDAPLDLRATRRYLSDPVNLFLLAFKGRTALGFLRGTFLLQTSTRRRQFFLYEIAVAPSARRRGVATALVERMLSFARRKGCEEAFVFTSPSNRAAVALYRSTGGRTETDADRMYVYSIHPHRRGRS